MTVKLEKLSQDQLLYSVEGKNKAVRYCCDTWEQWSSSAVHPASFPAAASILRDMVNIPQEAINL